MLSGCRRMVMVAVVVYRMMIPRLYALSLYGAQSQAFLYGKALTIMKTIINRFGDGFCWCVRYTVCAYTSTGDHKNKMRVTLEFCNVCEATYCLTRTRGTYIIRISASRMCTLYCNMEKSNLCSRSIREGRSASIHSPNLTQFLVQMITIRLVFCCCRCRSARRGQWRGVGGKNGFHGKSHIIICVTLNSQTHISEQIFWLDFGDMRRLLELLCFPCYNNICVVDIRFESFVDRGAHSYFKYTHLHWL